MKIKYLNTTDPDSYYSYVDRNVTINSTSFYVVQIENTFTQLSSYSNLFNNTALTLLDT